MGLVGRRWISATLIALPACPDDGAAADTSSTTSTSSPEPTEGDSTAPTTTTSPAGTTSSDTTTTTDDVNAPGVMLGADLYPLEGAVEGTSLDLSKFADQPDYDRDFNGMSKGGFTFRGAHAGEDPCGPLDDVIDECVGGSEDTGGSEGGVDESGGSEGSASAGTTGGGSMTTAASTSTGAGEGTGGDTSGGAGEDDDAEGCGCGATRLHATWWLVAVALVRRRRARS